MTKKFLSILLALALCVTLLPTAALADSKGAGTGEPTVIKTDDTGKIWRGEGEWTAVDGTYQLPPGSYQLGSNVTLDKPLLISVGEFESDNGEQCTLDLNGHDLEAQVTVGEYIAEDLGNGKAGKDIKGCLTIVDNSEYGDGSLTNSNTTLTVINGSVTLTGGTIECSSDSSNQYAVALATVSGETVIRNATGFYANGGTVAGNVNVPESGFIQRGANAEGTTVFNGDVTNGENGRPGGTISAGTFTGNVSNYGTISGGTFYGTVTNQVNSNRSNQGTIASVTNNGVIVFATSYQLGEGENKKDITDAANAEAAADFISGLSLSGTGYVCLGNMDNTDPAPTYYSHSGTQLTKYTNSSNKSELNLTSDVDLDGYNSCITWNDNTLTLNNVVLDEIILPNGGSVIIVVQGYVTVGSITYGGADSDAGPDLLTIQGSSTADTLVVRGYDSKGIFLLKALTLTKLTADVKSITSTGDDNDMILNGAEVIVRGDIQWGEGTRVDHGVILDEGSHLTAIGSDSGSQLCAQKITIKDDVSTLTLQNTQIVSTASAALQGLEFYCPTDDGAPYSIGDPVGQGSSYYLLDKNSQIVKNLTLKQQPVEVDYTITVTRGGNVSPTGDLTLSVEYWGETNAQDPYATVSGKSVTLTGNETYTDNKYAVEGTLTFTGTHEALINSFLAGYVVKLTDPGTNWTNWNGETYIIGFDQNTSTDDGGVNVTAPSPNTLKAWTAASESDPDSGVVTYSKGPVAEQVNFSATYTQNGGGNNNNTGSTYYTITASAGTGGSISPGGAVSVLRGSDKSFTITPGAGYEVSDVLVDGQSVGAVTGYTFKDVKTSHTIKAVFAADSGTILPNGLNHEDHVAYIQGFADGLFRPNAPITRAQTAVMLYRLLTPERLAEIETDAHSFSDVAAGDWYSHEVATMANGGYITGYSDGTFGGGRSITRAEFVTILTRFIGQLDADCDFTDVPESHWAYRAIATATQAGWIAGYADGSFRPDQTITRAQVVTIINRALDRGVDADAITLAFNTFPDNPADAWHYDDVIEAANGHDYTGRRPSESWTALR